MPNRLSAGAPPQTPLGELTALPRLPSWFRGVGPPGKGMREGRGQRREGKGWSPGMPKFIVDKPSRNYIE